MAVAKVVEIIGSSTKSFEDAIHQGITRASETLENVRSAWIKEQQVKIRDGGVSEYRVTMKATFVLKDGESHSRPGKVRTS